ncbi:MAG: hypothetical protein KKA07_13350, partial [Bacteroidetes bacterium]|nr:hypothetical protein [Bacteroidota bacterium]
YDSFDKNRQETIVQNLNPDSDANQTQIPSSVDSLSPQPDNKYKVLQESEEQDRESEKAAEIVSISDAEMSKHSRSSGSGGGDAKLKSPKATTFFEVVDDETEVDFSFDFKPALDQDSKDEESVVEFANVSDDKFVAEEAKEDLTVVASGKSSGEKKNKETNTESTTKDGTGFFRAGTEGKKSKSSNKDELKKSEAAPAGTNAQTAVMEKEADASKADSGSMFTPVLADDNREEDSGVTLGGSYDITLYSKGLEAYDRRDFQTAAGLFEQEIQKNSWNTASFLYAGISYLNLNKNLPALSCFNKVIQSGDPEFLEEATFYRAKALIAIDNPAEARKDLEKVINMNGKFKLQASILLQEIK